MATLVAWQVAKEHAESETGTVAMVVEAAQNAAGTVDNKAHQAVATVGKTAQQAKQSMCNASCPLYVCLDFFLLLAGCNFIALLMLTCMLGCKCACQKRHSKTTSNYDIQALDAPVMAHEVKACAILVAGGFGTCNKSSVTAGAAKKAGEAWTAGTSSKSAVQMQKRKQAMAEKLSIKKASGVRKSIGVKKSSGVRKSSGALVKGKAVLAKAGKVSGRVSEAAKHAAASAVQSVQKV